MAFLFRGIGNKAWWDKSRDDFPWLGENELISDVLKSLGTVDGSLSTYVIHDDKSNLDRVVAALASGRTKIENFDYLLVPLDAVRTNFVSDNTIGKTPDAKVNEWHLDIVHLTPAKLAHLSYIINNHKESLCRLLKPDVKSVLQTSKDNEFLDMSKVNAKLANALD